MEFRVKDKQTPRRYSQKLCTLLLWFFVFFHFWRVMSRARWAASQQKYVRPWDFYTLKKNSLGHLTDSFAKFYREKGSTSSRFRLYFRPVSPSEQSLRNCSSSSVIWNKLVKRRWLLYVFGTFGIRSVRLWERVATSPQFSYLTWRKVGNEM